MKGFGTDQLKILGERGTGDWKEDVRMRNPSWETSSGKLRKGKTEKNMNFYQKRSGRKRDGVFFGAGRKGRYGGGSMGCAGRVRLTCAHMSHNYVLGWCKLWIELGRGGVSRGKPPSYGAANRGCMVKTGGGGGSLGFGVGPIPKFRNLRRHPPVGAGQKESVWLTWV